MLDFDAVGAAGLITSQISSNRTLDALHDLSVCKRELAANYAAESYQSALQRQLNELGLRFNGLIDDYNRLLAVQRETQQEMSKLKDEVERQREQIDEGQRYSKDLREVADIYRAEILRLDPDSFY